MTHGLLYHIIIEIDNQVYLLRLEDKPMKIGIIKRDIAFPKPESYFQRLSWWNEAKKILAKYPEYEYLKNDPDTKTVEEYYENVTRAYLVDCILKENKELKGNYKQIKTKNRRLYSQIGDNRIHYKKYNSDFLQFYYDQLREKAHPGILDVEEAIRKQNAEAHRQEMERLEANHRAAEKQAARQIQQDLNHGKRVVCPYCKSTNTEKINIVSRMMSVSFVGVVSSKIGKQWHCNNCKSDF